MMLTCFGGHPIFSRVFKRPSLLTGLKTFVWSTKALKIGTFSFYMYPVVSGREYHVNDGFVYAKTAMQFGLDVL